MRKSANPSFTGPQPAARCLSLLGQAQRFSPRWGTEPPSLAPNPELR